MKAFGEETVLNVHHWTDTLFSFTTTRDPGFRFENGQFAMIGLMVEGKPLVRAYSMASANYEDHLEFFSIKVPGGPLTSRLQHIKPGDTVLVGRKPTGTLIVDNLKPGRNLYLFSTGTGLAPFLSIIRHPDVYERFEKVILTHGVRHIAELAHREMITRDLPAHEYFGELAREKLLYFPSVTREDFENRGRITTLLSEGVVTDKLSLPTLDPAQDRAMICGGPGMLADMTAYLESVGFTEGASHTPGEYVVEKAFVEK